MPLYRLSSDCFVDALLGFKELSVFVLPVLGFGVEKGMNSLLSLCL